MTKEMRLNDRVVIELENERAPSWNVHWAGAKRKERIRIAQEKHLLVRSVIDPRWKPFDVPVIITIIAEYIGKPVDSSNVCLKPYEDALKTWLIHDDDPRYVVETRSIGLNSKRNHITLILEPVQGDHYDYLRSLAIPFRLSLADGKGLARDRRVDQAS
jgi:hypothetical protein